MMYIYSLIFISLLIHYNLTFTKSYLGFYIFFLSCPNFLERHIYCWALKFIRKYFSISFRSLFNMSFVKILRSEKKLRLLSVFTSHGVINGLFAHAVLIEHLLLYDWRHQRYVLLVKLRRYDYFLFLLFLNIHRNDNIRSVMIIVVFLLGKCVPDLLVL